MRTPTPLLSSYRRHQAGLSLIELMIAVLLGLLVVAAGMGLLLSNRKTYGTTQGISRVQENQRLAFDMLSADIRAAGDFPCAALTRPGRLVAQVDNYPADRVGNLSFWDNTMEVYRTGIHPEVDDNGNEIGIAIYTAYILRDRYVDPSESMSYRYAVISHDRPEGPIKIQNASSFTTSGPQLSDLVVCNADRAVVFHASQVTGTHEIYHAAGATPWQGGPNDPRTYSNCGSAFIYDPAKRTELRAALDQGKCGQAVASPGGNNRYCFGPDAKVGENGCDRVGNSQAFVVRLGRIGWTYGYSYGGNGGLSRDSMNYGFGSAGENVVEGVRSVEFKYRLYGESTYKTAAEIDPDFNKRVPRPIPANSSTMRYPEYTYNPIWGRVDSVYIKIEFEASESSGLGKGDTQGTDGNTLNRTLEGYVMIRNRLRNQPDGG